MQEKRILLVEPESGRTRPVPEGAPSAPAAIWRWEGFFLEEDFGIQLDSTDVCTAHHVVSLSLDASLTGEWQGEHGSVSKTIEPGQVSFVPARLPFSTRHETGGTIVRLAIEPRFFLSATAEVSGLEMLALPCWLGFEDTLLRELILSLRTEARSGCPLGSSYAETLVNAITMHLVRKCCSEARAPRASRGGLTKFQLRRVTEFVEENLAENIPLQALAGISGLSPFHFARMFKQSTAMSPHQYLIRSRVLRARELLLVHGANLADVAAQVGFCDQSHLAAHFKRICGLTPSAFVKRIPARKILT